MIYLALSSSSPSSRASGLRGCERIALSQIATAVRREIRTLPDVKSLLLGWSYHRFLKVSNGALHARELGISAVIRNKLAEKVCCCGLVPLQSIVLDSDVSGPRRRRYQKHAIGKYWSNDGMDLVRHLSNLFMKSESIHHIFYCRRLTLYGCRYIATSTSTNTSNTHVLDTKRPAD